MSWKPWKLDVANELKSEVKPKFIKLHPMMIELVISIDSKAETELKNDPKFMVSMIGLCKSHSKTAVQKMKSVLTHADKSAAGFTSDAQMAGMFLRPIHMEMEKYFDDGCEDIQKEVGSLFAKKRKEEESLKKSAIKVDLDLKFDGLEIPQKGGSDKKKVVGGGAVKLPALDVDLDKDIDIASIKTFVTTASKTGKELTASLSGLASLLKEDADQKDHKDLEKERQEIEKSLKESAASLEKANEDLKNAQLVLEKAQKNAGKTDDELKEAAKLKQDKQATEAYKAKKNQLEAQKKRLEAEKKRIETEEALEEKKKANAEKLEGLKVKEATATVNTLLGKFQHALDSAVAEWKKQIAPLKGADKLIREWEDDVADSKDKFTPQVKSKIQAELNKVKLWSAPLMKAQIALSTALKDAGIAKKFTEARDQVLEKKSTWEGLADEATDWCTDVDRLLTSFETQLKRSGKTLDASVKIITKLASQKG